MGNLPKGTLLRGPNWSKVPSHILFLNKLKIQSCKGANTHCVQASTIANTLILPAGSCLMDSFPIVNKLCPTFK